MTEDRKYPTLQRTVCCPHSVNDHSMILLDKPCLECPCPFLVRPIDIPRPNPSKVTRW